MVHSKKIKISVLILHIRGRHRIPAYAVPGVFQCPYPVVKRRATEIDFPAMTERIWRERSLQLAISKPGQFYVGGTIIAVNVHHVPHFEILVALKLS
ncbi:hypothetical protein D3C76_1212380 [compost metagenome]